MKTTERVALRVFFEFSSSKHKHRHSNHLIYEQSWPFRSFVSHKGEIWRVQGGVRQSGNIKLVFLSGVQLWPSAKKKNSDPCKKSLLSQLSSPGRGPSSSLSHTATLHPVLRPKRFWLWSNRNTENLDRKTQNGSSIFFNTSKTSWVLLKKGVLRTSTDLRPLLTVSVRTSLNSFCQRSDSTTETSTSFKRKSQTQYNR